MATFSQLPPELVEYVISYLAQPDVSAFSRANKSLYALALPFLYRCVDLSISPGDRLPRIDRFCLNIVNDSRLARRVESLRLGLSPHAEAQQGGQRWLPADRNFDDGLMFDKAMDAFNKLDLFLGGHYMLLRDAICMREYSAYAALIFLHLPSLRRLEIADFRCASLDHLSTIFHKLGCKPLLCPLQPYALPSSESRMEMIQTLHRRLSSIKHVLFNVDILTGTAYAQDFGTLNLDHIPNLPGITKLEISIPCREGTFPSAFTQPLPYGAFLKIQPTNITTLIIRHSGPVLQLLYPLLSCTPQLQSFAYDMFYDSKKREAGSRLIDLAAWSEALQQVQGTLEKLVFSVEYCDTGLFSFQQPRIGDELHGYLDLTNFEQLHTLHVPFPFLTGDVGFSITTEIYPLLPPNLRHLSLRPDLSHAQFSFPFDTSVLASALTLQESETEAKAKMNARMDVSYMFHATLVLLDHASNLETISVWQVADPSLSWFDGQVADFATTCKNKAISGKIVYPMMLRWKKSDHWNLIKEVTVFDRTSPTQSQVEKLYREEWDGIPLGLASQYHLHALRSHQVRIHR